MTATMPAIEPERKSTVSTHIHGWIVCITVQHENRREVAEYYVRPIDAFFGEKAVEFVKYRLSEIWHVRYGPNLMVCDCPGGQVHDMNETKPICKHCLCLQDLIGMGLLPGA